ncbi:MAG: hypothetical protein QM820_34745 [Minicystis sp.]
MPTDDDALHLLLARAGDNRPVLPDGLPLSAAVAPERVETLPDAPATRGANDPNAGDAPEDVPMSPPEPAPPLWGVIVPEGPAGDRLLALADRLIKHREARQGRPAPVYRVPRASGPMSLSEALAWRTTHYDTGADLGAERAELQLILGDLDQVPLAIQKVQSIDGYVGRLFFADEKGYDAYIDKVLRAEGAPRRGPGRVVLHTAHDGSRALDLGLEGLTAPGEALLRAGVAGGEIQAREILSYAVPSEPGKDVLLQRVSAPDPGVLFTMSHGLGLPIDGWRSPAAQRGGQGAMQFGITDSLIGDEIRTGTFMPSGLWFCFACFSAGTPDASVYAPWLERLTARGRTPPDLGRALAMEAPFVADLPQKALCNPDGPLAFVGHVDLAWTHSFRDDDDPQQRRAGRFMRVLTSALAGDPVGVAFQKLTQFVLEADAALTYFYARDVAPVPAALDAATERQRALLWMRRQDLGGFILLGDPAVELPVGVAAPARAVGDVTVTTTLGTSPPGAALERAVLEVLLADKSLAAIAGASGIDATVLERAAALYREAGRRAIGLDP